MGERMFKVPFRAVDAWGNKGEVVGWDEPIKLTYPMGRLKANSFGPAIIITEIGGYYLFRKDKDGSVGGVHPAKIKIDGKT